MAVYQTLKEAVGRARSGKGPTLIDCKTYRHGGHSRSDGCHYRPPGEKEKWLKKDWLRLLLRKITEQRPGTASVHLERALLTYADPDAPLHERVAYWPIHKVLDKMREALPPHLVETAYAFAVETAAADGSLQKEELRLLQIFRVGLGVDRLIATAIERGAHARHALLN